MLTSEKPDLPKTQVQILDAAINCVKKLGIERVTLNDIAKEAGVARSTVYSYYSNKDDVVKFALLQSAYSFAEKVFVHLSQFATPTERIIEAVMFSLRSLPDEPCLALITDTTLAQMVNDHTLTSEPGFNINTEIFRFLIQDDSLSEQVITERAEFTIRTMFSLLAMKSPVKRSYHEQASFVARWLLPPLELEIPAEYQMNSADMEADAVPAGEDA
jgi:AcrR family transcriptional regulator